MTSVVKLLVLTSEPITADQLGQALPGLPVDQARVSG
jgi:hypothetical protein